TRDEGGLHVFRGIKLPHPAAFEGIHRFELVALTEEFLVAAPLRVIRADGFEIDELFPELGVARLPEALQVGFGFEPEVLRVRAHRLRLHVAEKIRIVAGEMRALRARAK